VCDWERTPVRTCMYMCMHACVHTCARILVHTRSPLNAACQTMCKCARRMKRTVSHDTPWFLEVLLLLVQSQRSISCWVAPNTSPYGEVGSCSFLELFKKKPERGLLRSALIRRPLAVCGHHMRNTQLMTTAWFKSE